MWFKFATKNLIRKKSYSLFFLLNFSISLVAIFSLFLFQNNIQSYIQTNAKQILTGELSVQARRPLAQKELQSIETSFANEIERRSEQIQAYSMAFVDNKSRLVLIKAVDQNFPLFGSLILNDKEVYPSEKKQNLFSDNVLWVYPELLVQLKLEVGDKLKLGSKEFVIEKVVTKDVGLGGFGSALAPAVYMSLENIKSTGLVGFGSTAWYTTFFDLKNSENMEEIQTAWNDKLEDPAIRVNIYTNANQQVGRLQNYLGDYLGLVALVSLLLSIVGAYYLFRSHLVEQAKSIALLEINGAGEFLLIQIFVSQILILSGAAGLISLFISSMLGQQWIKILNLGSQYEAVSFNVLPALMIFSALLLFVVLCMLPFAWKFIRMDKTSSLMEAKTWDWDFKLKDVLSFLPALLVFCGLSIYISKSYTVGGIFLAVLAFGFLFTYLSYRIIIFLSHRIAFKSFSVRYVFRYLARDSFGSISILFALGISFLLMGLIPQLQKSLRQELLFPNSQLIPDLFLFDIQDEQVDILKSTVKEQEAELKYLSAMVRSRLMKVNGVDFEKPRGMETALTREEEREKRFRNRGFNLSYRSSLSSSETLLEGVFKGEEYNDSTSGTYPAISIEKRFMDRLSLKMGDLLEFDIGGVPITGKIESIRSVKWTSFQPNFFLLFQPGVLEEAPKTYLGAIGGLEKKQKQDLQNAIVERMPNVSIVDVEYLVLRILELFEKMAFAIEVLAFFSFIAGLFMVFVIANTRAKERKRDFLYLKLFGAKDSFLHSLFQLEFFIVVSVSFLFSVILTFAFTYFLVSYVFESSLVIDLKYPFILYILGVGLCALLSYLVTARLLQKEEYSELLSS